MTESRFNLVLLIDDNEIDNFINRKMILKTGFSSDVVDKTSGSAALEYLETTAKENKPLPDIIFLDIMMPAMDGFEFLENYAKLPSAVHQHSRIVMLSSTESFKDLNRANSNPYVYKFLNKPLTEAILNAIR